MSEQPDTTPIAEPAEPSRHAVRRDVLLGALVTVLAAGIGAGSSILTTFLANNHQATQDRQDFLRQSRQATYSQVLDEFNTFRRDSDVYVQKVLAQCGHLMNSDPGEPEFKAYMAQEEKLRTVISNIQIVGSDDAWNLADTMLTDIDNGVSQSVSAVHTKPMGANRCRIILTSTRLPYINRALKAEAEFIAVAKRDVDQ